MKHTNISRARQKYWRKLHRNEIKKNKIEQKLDGKMRREDTLKQNQKYMRKRLNTRRKTLK